MSTDIIAAMIVAIATIIAAVIDKLGNIPPVPGPHIRTPRHYRTNWKLLFSVILMVMGLVFSVSGMMRSGYNNHQFVLDHQFVLGIGCYIFGLLMVVLFR